MKIKKIFNMLAAAGLGALLLTGCGVPKNRVFSTDDLPGKTIGVQSGTTGQSYALELEKNPAEGQPAAKVVDYKLGSEAVEALLKGEIDCVIIDNEPAKHFILQNDTLQILPDIFVNEYYAIAVNKGKSLLTSELNGAMTELINDGTIDKILANYIGDSTGSFKYTSPENVSRGKGKLAVATAMDFAPYIDKNTDGVFEGIDVDVIWALCDKLGYEPEITDMPFEDIIGAVKSGEYDIGIGAITITDDRMNDVDFTESYAQGVQVIITRKQ